MEQLYKLKCIFCFYFSLIHAVKSRSISRILPLRQEITAILKVIEQYLKPAFIRHFTRTKKQPRFQINTIKVLKCSKNYNSSTWKLIHWWLYSLQLQFPVAKSTLIWKLCLGTKQLGDQPACSKTILNCGSSWSASYHVPKHSLKLKQYFMAWFAKPLKDTGDNDVILSCNWQVEPL